MCNNYFRLLNRLPNELKRLIYFFIPVTVKIYLTKENYINFHYKYIYSNIRDEITYARKLITYDMKFIFNLYVYYIKDKIHKKKKLTYLKQKYNSLYHLFTQLCIKYQANNCRNLLLTFNNNN